MPPFVRTVSITNYKSIARCRVDLGPLTFLVGPNGSGKSNFLDALRFVADALNTTLEQSLRDRGGIQSVRRRSRGHPTHFGIRLDLTLPGGRAALYSFKVGAERNGAFVVQREECRVSGPEGSDQFYVAEEGGVVQASLPVPTALVRDRLALVAISGLPEFRPVYESLRRMGFYNLNPERIRDLQDPDPGQILARDGRNLAAVVRELGRFEGGRVLFKVAEHLQAVVPGVMSVEHRTLGPKETIEFRQQVTGDQNPWRFMAAEMSDGTLRSLGILVAAFQAELNGQPRASFVGIEEPEMALHPGAAEIIAEVLLLASDRVQVVATTHSPDLLNHKAIREENLLAVMAEAGATVVGPIEPGARSVLRDRLYAAGELLSQGPIEPDRELVEQSLRQLKLFSDQVE
jgi:predicted ATPase